MSNLSARAEFPCRRIKGVLLVDKATLRLIWAEVIMTFPVLDRFKPSLLADLYAKLHRVHSYQMFEDRGDNGALMVTENEGSFEIDRYHIEITEENTGIDLVKRNAVDLFSTAREHVGDLRGSRVRKITLRALWPCPAAESGETFISDLVRERTTKFTEDQLEFLGEVHGISFDLRGTLEDPHRHFSVEIAPYLRDENQLYLEVSHTFYMAELEKIEVLGECVQMTYDFLVDNVTKFVKTFMP